MDQASTAVALGLHFVEIDGSGVTPPKAWQRDGRSGTMPGRQIGYLNTGNRYPITVQIDTPEGKAPYRPGLYLIAGDVFEPGEYGRLNFKGGRDLHLVPLDEAIAALTHAQAAFATPGAKPKLQAAS